MPETDGRHAPGARGRRGDKKAGEDRGRRGPQDIA